MAIPAQMRFSLEHLYIVQQHSRPPHHRAAMNPFKTSKASIIYVLFLFHAVLGMAQGTFQNLDFEDAIYKVPDVPSGQYGTPVSTADGIPGWTAYYGTDQASQILHNNIALGAVS